MAVRIVFVGFIYCLSIWIAGLIMLASSIVYVGQNAVYIQFAVDAEHAKKSRRKQKKKRLGS